MQQVICNISFPSVRFNQKLSRQIPSLILGTITLVKNASFQFSFIARAYYK